ncbi:protein translocase subunit SecD [Roseibacillus persicicus]|uniref:Multifunctional fusion protein n=1 Tax=Roseibacillus persicicus TaxID=454148 RepID=A0A918TVB3_9BACT|nr:protein translocase subunit SecD [Roseibacillus persicicus]GHC61712.1 protein translocase subunit SecDF [Roseibacillus persicicus]
MNPYIIFFVGLLILGLLFAYFAAEKDRNKKKIGTLVTIVLVGLCGLAMKTEGLKSGIDLKGGSAFTVRVDPKKDEQTGQPVQVTPQDQQTAIQVISKRLDPDGVKDMTIQAQGDDRITIEMPGTTEEEAKEIAEILQKQAVLNFRAVHPDNATLAFQVESGAATRPPGYELLQEPVRDEDGKPVTEPILDDEGNPVLNKAGKPATTPVTSPILVKRRVEVKGSQIKSAFPDFSRPGVMNIVLTKSGGEAMRKYTANIVPGRDRMAHVLDGKVLSAPGFQSKNLGAQFIITGISGGTAEVERLSQQLMNPLENPLMIEEQRQVSARLGAATIKQGIYAGIAGLLLTLVFVTIYYRFAGIVALLGLVVNIAILFGAMAMFGFTFTLPGIAGIILTIGVAVDANVLIFERLREELAAGKSVSGAIKSAYEKAFSAIFDANITTLITALILFWRASGTVKGFAITLTIGILASMFAALLVTRVLFWWFQDAGAVKKLSFLNLVPDRTIDFLSKGKIAFFISGGLIILSLVMGGIKRENALGIDFLGGALTRFELGDKEIPVPEVQASVEKLTLDKIPQVQEEKSASGFSLAVRSSEKDVPAVVAQLRETFPQLAEIEYSTENVSSSLGADFLKNSLIALGIGLVGILIYITLRFEFSFALGAFVALAHDVIICVGILMLLGREFSLIHVGAILTIAGYSINDTIVVFDRIREQLQLRSGDISVIMNEAINATLSRTILTSATTFVAVLVLFIFGGSAMRDFALAMMIGVIVGTYSSIFVAAPVVAWWSKKRGTNLRAEVIDAQLEAQVMPGKG